MADINDKVKVLFEHGRELLKNVIVGSNVTNRKTVDKHLNHAIGGFAVAGLGSAIDYVGKVQTDPNVARTVHGIALPIAVAGGAYGLYHRLKADRETQRYLDKIKSELDEHKKRSKEGD